MIGLICLLFSGLFSTGTSLAYFSTGAGAQYVTVTEQGRVGRFNAAHLHSYTDSNSVWYRIDLSATYRIIGAPVYIPGAANSLLVIGVSNESNGSLNVATIDGTLKVQPSVNQSLNGRLLSQPIWWAATKMLYAIDETGVRCWSLSNGNLQAASSPINSNAARSISAHQDTLEIGLNNGKVEKWVFADGAVRKASELGQSYPGILNGPVHSGPGGWIVSRNSQDLAVWNGVKWENYSPPVAFVDQVVVDTGFVRILGTDGSVWDLISGVWRHRLRSTFQKLGFVIDAGGVYQTAEASQAPSAFSIFGKLNILHGLFHHRGDLAVGPLHALTDPWNPSRGPLGIQMGVVGNAQATWSVAILSDSVNNTVVDSVQKNSELSAGTQDLLWDGRVNQQDTVASGLYWVNAKIISSYDTASLWARVRIQRSGVAGEPVLISNSPGSVLSMGRLRLDSKHVLRIDLSKLKHPIPFDFVASLEDSASGSKIKFSRSFGSNVSDTVNLVLNGKDQSGTLLPASSWALNLSAKDSAGNISNWNSPLLVNVGASSEATSIYVTRPFRPYVSGRVEPMVINASSHFEGGVSLSVQAGPLDSVFVSLFDAKGNLVRCGNQTSQYSWEIMNAHGEWNSKFSCRFDSLGSDTGVQQLRMVASSPSGDTTECRIPYIYGTVKTKILSPFTGQVLGRGVAVTGVAGTASAENGSSWYRIYAARGAVRVTDSKRIEGLLGSTTWQPLVVPMDQRASSYTGMRRQNSDPADFSNVGVPNIGGTLGWFTPVAKDTSWYTILVATEDNGVLSWDTASVHWVPNPTQIVPRLIVVDSTQSGLVDLSDTPVENDSALWKISSSSSPLQTGLQVLLLDSTQVTGWKSCIRTESFLATSEQTHSYLFNGRDASGAPLPAGKYSVRLTAWDDVTGTLIQRSMPIQFTPSLIVADSFLTILPSPARSFPSLGLKPKVQIKARFSGEIAYRVLVKNWLGATVAVLADSTLERAPIWNWNFTQNGKPLWSASAGDTSKFYLDVSPTSDSTKLTRVTFSVISETDVIDTSLGILGTKDTLDSLERTSAFKFRVKASGELNWFPVRRIAVAPRITGKQTIRKFLNVPWNIDYVKFYNSLEWFSEASWTMNALEWHIGWWNDDEYHQIGTTAPSRRQTSYSVPWGVRRNKLNIDTSISLAKSAFQLPRLVDDSTTPLLSSYYGDLPWIPIKCPDESCDNSLYYPLGMVGHYSEVPKQDRKYETDPNALDYRGVFGRDTSACSFKSTLNTYEFQDRNSFCKVMGKTYNQDINGDRWVGVVNGNLNANFAVPTEKGLTVGARFFELAGTVGQNAVSEVSVNDSGIVRGNDVGSHYQLHWAKRDGSNGTITDLSTQPITNRLNDEDQAIFCKLPEFDWMNPKLLLHARKSDSINYFDLTANLSPIHDPAKWGGSSAAKNLNRYKGSYYDEFGGRKVGVRGFAYQPIGQLQRAGRTLNQFDYIENFFNRDSGSGMAYWAMSQSAHENADDLAFRPKLKIDSSMFQITWDTLSLSYPLGAEEDLKGEPRLERDLINKSLVAYEPKLGVDNFGFSEDTAAYLTLMPRRHISNGDGAVDSVLVDLSPYFSAVRYLTDSAVVDSTLGGLVSPQDLLKRRPYGRVYFNSLKWDVPLRSYRVNPDGTLDPAYDTSSVFHSVFTHSAKTYRDSNYAWIKYNNKGVTLGAWTSEMDPLFRKAKGWIYGVGDYNSTAFHTKNDALSLETGFLGLVDASRLDTAAPSNVSPFVRETTADGKALVKFNPQLTTDKFKWNLETFYADGATNNSDLDTAGLNPNNFKLSIRPGSSSRVFSPLRGTIAESISRNGIISNFSGYSIFVRASGDTVLSSVPVNRFFTKDSLGGMDANIVPNARLDPWGDTTQMPVLGWWDVSRLNGKYEVLITVRYANAIDGKIQTLIERHAVNVGIRTNNDTTVTISAPYQRAQLRLPKGTTGPSSTILSVVSSAELQRTGKLPSVTTLGPILEIQTTGNKYFSTPLPILTYNIGARELWLDQGYSESEFDSLNIDSVVHFMDAVKSKYSLTVLNSDGLLNSVVTTGSPFAGTDIDACYLTLTGMVPHFSYAFVLRDDGHNGHRPVVMSVSVSGPNVIVKGSYSDSDQSFYETRLPTDLEMSWSSDTSAAMAGYAGTRNVQVGYDGSFVDTLPLSLFNPGWNAVALKYTGSSLGVRKMFNVAADGIVNWHEGPQPVTPNCGDIAHQTFFTAPAPGLVIRQVRDPNGTLIESRTLNYLKGDNALPWDACRNGIMLEDGRWQLDYIFAENLGARSISVAVGAVSPIGVKHLSASLTTFSPSVSNLKHQVVFQIQKWPGTTPTLVIVSPDGHDSISVAIDSSNDSVAWASWNGHLASGLAGKGDWKVRASAPNIPGFVEVMVRVVYLQSPGIALVAEGNPYTWPLQGATISLTTGVKLVGELSLLDEQGKPSGTKLGQWTLSQIPVGTKKFGWSATGPGPLPRNAVLRWTTLDGIQGGQDTVALNLTVARLPIDSLKSSPAADSIHPDFTAALARSLGWDDMSRVVSFDFGSSDTGRVVLHVSGIKGTYREDTFSVHQGLNRVVWNANDTSGSLVPEGAYTLRLSALPRHLEGAVTVLGERVVRVRRLPELVVVRDGSAQGNPTLGAGAGLLDGLFQGLIGRVPVRVRHWPSDAALQYMALVPNGAVALADEVPDTTIFMGDPDNGVRRYVRDGGRVAFVGSLPLSKYRKGFDVVSDRASTQVILGLNSPWRDPDNYAERDSVFFDSTYLNTFDSSVLSFPILDAGDTAWAPGVREQALLNAPGVWASLSTGFHARRDTVNGVPVTELVRTVSSFYGKPVQSDGVDSSVGALLSVHPLGSTLPSEDARNIGNDLGQAIYRYFFNNDLSIRSAQVIVDPLQHLRGQKLNINVGFSFAGEMRLDSVVLRFADNIINDWDTAVVLRGIDASWKNVKQITLAIPDTGAFGDHKLTIELLPFRQVVDGDTVVEDLVANNVVVMPWVLTDSTTPTVSFSKNLMSGIDLNQFVHGWSSNSEADSFVVSGIANANHKLGGLKFKFLLSDISGNVLASWKDSVPKSDSVVWRKMFAPQQSLINGDQYRLTAMIEDRFGNSGSAVAKFTADSVLPNIATWKVMHGVLDTSKLSGIPTYSRKSGMLYDTLLLLVSDNLGVAKICVDSGVGGVCVDSLQSPDWGARSLQKSFIVPAATALWNVHIVDISGNHKIQKMKVVYDTTHPVLNVWKVGFTRLDSLLKRVNEGVTSGLTDPSMVSSKPIYLQKVDSLGRYEDSDPMYASLLTPTQGVPGNWERSLRVKKGDEIRLVLDAYSKVGTTRNVMIDDQVIPMDSLNPYLRAGDSALSSAWAIGLKKHPRQRILQLQVTKPEHEIQWQAMDPEGRISVARIMLETPEADLQVIDSANDACHGPDLGEVYMRQSVGAKASAADTGLWTYWLMHTRNSLDTTRWGVVRLLVDADNDSTTGVLAGQFQGADSALDLVRGNASDVGSGAYARKLAWQSGLWVPVTGFIPEGRWDSLGLRHAGNHADVPATIEVGTGVQKTPIGTIANPEMGIWEIGWRLGTGVSRKQLRWALASQQLCGDTVLDSNGRMLHFSPRHLKNATTDGATSDWLSWREAGSLVAMSQDSVRSTNVRTTIAVRNPGIGKMTGFRVRYYWHAQDSLAVGLDPALTSTSLQGAVLMSAPRRWTSSGMDSSNWSTDLVCASCDIGSGNQAFVLGSIVKAGATGNGLDWSAHSPKLSDNPHVVVWSMDGTLLWGVEPSWMQKRQPIQDTVTGIHQDPVSITGADTILAVSSGSSTSFGGLNYLEAWSHGAGRADSVSWLDSVDASCAALAPVTGEKILRIGYQGSNLLGVKFGTSDTGILSRYTNLEFWVAASRDWPSRRDRDIPVRMWLTHQVKPGAGDDNQTSEEDFTYLQAFLGKGHLSQKWQKVSIPLAELFQKLNNPANGRNDSLFLKFMLDNSGGNSDIDSSRRADLLFSGMKFVKYGQSSPISTRRVEVTLVGESENPINRQYMDLNPRLLNASGLPLSQDSLRIRIPVYDSARPTLSFNATSAGVGTDESVDWSWFNPTVTWELHAKTVSSEERLANYEVIQTWSDRATLAPLKGWQAESYVMFRYVKNLLQANGRSIQYALPDYSKSYSFLTGVAVEHLGADGTWKRMWGVLPSENPDTVSYWKRQSFRSPSDTVYPASSWVSLGQCKDSISIDTTVKDTNLWKELTDSINVKDSVISELSSFAANTFGGWPLAITWSEDGSVVPVAWVDSIKQSCGSLYPVGAGKILTIPFQETKLQGVKFFSLDTGMRSRYTHLEFWVAASKSWDTGYIKDVPVRIWMNQQIAPGDGDKNHDAEEDFSLLHGYLPSGRLAQKWQKVSIPLDELYQYLNNPINGVSDSLFLKFMLDMTGRNVTDDSLRTNLHISGVRWVVRDTVQGRITTRRTDVAILTNRSSDIGNLRYDVRIMNQSTEILNSQKIRLVFPSFADVNYGISSASSIVGTSSPLATDDAIDYYSKWFGGSVYSKTLMWYDYAYLLPSRSVGLRLNTNIPAGLNIPYQGDAPMNRLSPYMLPGFAVDGMQANGIYRRLWGVLPGENADTVRFWHSVPTGMPSDTIAPMSSWTSGVNCTDSGNGTRDSSAVEPSVADLAGELPSATLSVCSGCAPVVFGGRAATRVENTNGGLAVNADFMVTQEVQNARYLAMDIVAPSCDLSVHWDRYIEIVRVNPDAQIWWDPQRVLVPGLSNSSWTTLSFDWNGSLLPLNSAMSVKLNPNIGCSDVFISNWRFVP